VGWRLFFCWPMDLWVFSVVSVAPVDDLDGLVQAAATRSDRDQMPVLAHLRSPAAPLDHAEVPFPTSRAVLERSRRGKGTARGYGV
jgi:hypothetical protein